MKVQLLLLLALVGPFTRASPTGLYGTVTGEDVTSATEAATVDAIATDPSPTIAHTASNAVEITTASTAVSTGETITEADTPTDAWTTSPELITSVLYIETLSTTEETTTNDLPTTDESTTTAVVSTENTTPPAPALPEETTTPAPGLTDPTVNEVLIAVTENYITAEEVNVEENTEEGLSSGQIVGIVIGAILAVVIVIAVVCAFVRRMGKYSP